MCSIWLGASQAKHSYTMNQLLYNGLIIMNSQAPSSIIMISQLELIMVKNLHLHTPHTIITKNLLPLTRHMNHLQYIGLIIMKSQQLISTLMITAQTPTQLMKSHLHMPHTTSIMSQLNPSSNISQCQQSGVTIMKTQLCLSTLTMRASTSTAKFLNCPLMEITIIGASHLKLMNIMNQLKQFGASITNPHQLIFIISINPLNHTN